MRATIDKMKLTSFHICAAIALFVVALYGRTYYFDLTYDDVLQVYSNPLVNNDLTALSAIGRILSSATPPGDLYRPVTTLSYWLQSKIHGPYAAPFHLFNTVLHGMVGVLAFLVLLPLMPGLGVAAAAALIFAVHPIAVEAVANVSGRAELLAAAGTLITLLLVAQRLTVLAAFSFVGSILCKESAITLIVLGPLYLAAVRWRESGNLSLKSPMRVAALFLLIAAIPLAMRYQALGERLLIRSDGVTIYPENPIFHLPLVERLIPALAILGRYLALIVFPVSLSADYSEMPNHFFMRLYSVEGVVWYTALATFLALVYSRRRSPVVVLGVWFFATFAVTSNILTVIGTLMGERLAYLPSIGAIGFITAYAYNCGMGVIGQKATKALLLIVISILSVGTYLRTEIWRNNDSLFAHTVKDAPSSPKAYYNYGVQFHAVHKNPIEAEKFLRAAIDLNPEYLHAMRTLADVLLEQKEYAKVEYWYRRILEKDPRQDDVRERYENLLKFKGGSE